MNKEAFEETGRKLAALFMNLDMNEYAMENVALGRILPGERIPLDTYLCDLGYGAEAVPYVTCKLSGNVLDECDTIRYRDVDAYYRRLFFNFQMSCVFEDAPKECSDFGADAMFLFKGDMRNYINGCFDLFCDIASYAVRYDAFDLFLPYSREEIRAGNGAAAKFLAAVRLRHLRRGTCVQRYFKRASYMSPFVRSLLCEKKGRLYLENTDTDSYAYKLALFSSFTFKGTENSALFGLKAKQWMADCA